MLSDAQREAHYSGIGSSTAAAVLGLDPWCTPYRAWQQLVDPDQRPDLADNPRIRLGNLFEPAICEAAAEHWGFETSLPDSQHTYRHATESWALAHPDRLVVNQNAAVEAKFRGSRMRAWYEDSNGEPIDTELVQCHWQMLVGGFECVYLAVVLGNEEERHFRIERSALECEYLLEEVGRWWRAYVVPRSPPPAVDLEDARRKWPRAAKGKTVEVTSEIAGVLSDYRAHGEVLRDLENKRDALYVRIAEAACDAEVLTHMGARVATWREQTKRNLDIKRLRAEQPALALQYEVENRFRVLRPCK